MKDNQATPALLILNQMAGPMTWELAEDAGEELGCVALLTGHPDTLQKSHPKVLLEAAAPYQRGSFPRRALSWLHYWLRAFLWLWRWPADIPVLLFSNPPILCWLGWLMKKLRGQRYSVMVHDIYPDILVRLAGYSERHPLIQLWRWLNRRAYEQADVVMTLGEYMAANLEKQFDSRKTRAGRVEVVYPWVDTDRIRPIPKEENWFAQKYGQVDKLTVMYSGNMGLGHDLESMVEAAKQVEAVDDVHFLFVGAGPKWAWIEKAVQQDGLTNVTLLPWQPEETLPFALATADVSLVSLETAMVGLAIPSKAIYALAAGAAVVVLADGKSELAQWQAVYETGQQVTPASLGEILLAYRNVSYLLPEHRQNARLAALKGFSRKENAQRVVSTVNSTFQRRAVSA